MAAKRVRKSAPAVSAHAPEPDIEIVKAVRFIQQIATIVNNTLRSYWLSGEDRSDTLAASYAFLDQLLESCPQITVRTLGDAFTVNGRNTEYRDSVTDALHAHLAQLGVDNFFFVSGVTADEFSKFCEILGSQPAEMKQLGDFSTVLERFQIRNIRTKKLIYREVAGAEVVLSKDEYERITDTGKGKGPGGDAGAGAGPGGETSGGALAGDILAFLKGDVAASDEKVAQSVREVASDPERMAELILKAAEIRERPADVAGGETLGDFVVACLRRTYEGLRQDPSFETPRGRKRAAHDLLLLEEEVLQRLREMKESECTEQDFETITTATEELTNEIKIDALTDEYVTKFNAAQAAEAQLLAAIRTEGIGPGGESRVVEKLAQGGVPPSDWQELVVKSGAERRGEWRAGPAFASSRILDAISHLDSLLDTMEREFERMSKAHRDEEAQKMLGVLQDVSSQIRQLTTQTGLAIQALLESVRKDETAILAAESALAKSGRPLALTRQDTFGTIARILGEISEPVELVRTSLDMMRSKAFADNPHYAESVLRLAGENTELIKTLLDSLRGLSDIPSSPATP